MTAHQVGETRHFRDFIDILHRRYRLILAIGILGAAAALAVGLYIPPMYTAQAQLLFAPAQSSPEGSPSDEMAVQTQVTMLTSYSHLQRVHKRLSSEGKPQQEEPAADGGSDQSPTDQLLAFLNAIPHALVSKADAVQHDSSRPEAVSPELTLEDLQHGLNVFRESHSRVIAITFRSSSAAEAALVANEVAKVYVETQKERNELERAKELEKINNWVQRLKEEVKQTDAAVQGFRIEHALGEDRNTDITSRQLADLNSQLALARREFSNRQERLSLIQYFKQGTRSAAEVIEALDNAELTDLYRQELALQVSDVKRSTLLNDGAPGLQPMDARLKEIKQKISQGIEQMMKQLEGEVQIAGSRVRSLEQRVSALQAASSAAAQPEVQLRELQRKATASAQLYDKLLQRQMEMRERLEAPSDVRILSLAAVPNEPSSPSPLLFVPPALVASSIAGGLLAMFFERLDRGMRSENDVNFVLGSSCIGLVPQVSRLRNMRPHHFLLNNPFSAYTEAIRSVTVAALELTNPRRMPKTFLITSSTPQEGKTTLAISFAAYAARLHRRVLLVDLDFRNPAVLREIGVDGGNGVLDLLDGHPLAEVVRYIPELGLDCLSLPDHPTDPLAFLASAQAPHLIRKLSEYYDCVVIDSASLLGTTEARLLASMVDKIIFVVKWGSTRQEVAQNALKLLSSAFDAERQAEIVSTVITQVDLKKHARYRFGDIGESLSRV